MHEKEAMWMGFSCKKYFPLAVLIGVGGINALNGEKLENKLDKDNYLVTPPQIWLDGWKNQDGNVYQFVSTSYGKGLTVAEQIIESETGGICIKVFEPKNPNKLVNINAPNEYSTKDEEYSCNYIPKNFMSEMGIGKGGKINQKIYSDPYGIDAWQTEPTAFTNIYLVNAEQFSKITGRSMPPLPISAKKYFDVWYKLHDNDMADISGTDVFTNLKGV